MRCFAVSPLLFVFVGGLCVSGTGAESGIKEQGGEKKRNNNNNVHL